MDIITKRCSSITIFLHSLLRKFCIQTQLRIAYSLMNISISIGSFHIQVVQCSLECIQVVLKYFYPRLIIEQNQLRIYSFLPKQWIHQRIVCSAQLHFPTSWRPKQNWESLSSASATAVGEEYRRLNKSSRHRSSRTYSGKKGLRLCRLDSNDHKETIENTSEGINNRKMSTIQPHFQF